eukprot:1174347-Rhodomonas_salina.1
MQLQRSTGTPPSPQPGEPDSPGVRASLSLTRSGRLDLSDSPNSGLPGLSPRHCGRAGRLPA